MPMGHDLHARLKLDTVDIEPGLRRVPEERYVLWRSRKALVDNILRKSHDIGLRVLSVSWRDPNCDRAESEQERSCERAHGCLQLHRQLREVPYCLGETGRPVGRL